MDHFTLLNILEKGDGWIRFITLKRKDLYKSIYWLKSRTILLYFFWQTPSMGWYLTNFWVEWNVLLVIEGVYQNFWWFVYDQSEFYACTSHHSFLFIVSDYCQQQLNKLAPSCTRVLFKLNKVVSVAFSKYFILLSNLHRIFPFLCSTICFVNFLGW